MDSYFPPYEQYSAQTTHRITDSPEPSPQAYTFPLSTPSSPFAERPSSAKAHHRRSHAISLPPPPRTVRIARAQATSVPSISIAHPPPPSPPRLVPRSTPNYIPPHHPDTAPSKPLPSPPAHPRSARLVRPAAVRATSTDSFGSVVSTCSSTSTSSLVYDTTITDLYTSFPRQADFDIAEESCASRGADARRGVTVVGGTRGQKRSAHYLDDADDDEDGALEDLSAFLQEPLMSPLRG